MEPWHSKVQLSTSPLCDTGCDSRWKIVELSANHSTAVPNPRITEWHCRELYILRLFQNVVPSLYFFVFALDKCHYITGGASLDCIKIGGKTDV